MKRAIGLLVAGLIGMNASAAGKEKKPVAAPPAVAAPVWAQEPDAFMGIRFDTQLASSLPECHRFTDAGNAKQMCFKRTPFPTNFSIYGLPKLAINYFPSLTATTWKDGIEALYLTSNTNDFEALKEIFITRYGQPTKVESETVKTLAGLELQNQALIWSGKQVTIRLDQYSDNIERTRASITNNEAMRFAYEADQKKTADSASKL